MPLQGKEISHGKAGRAAADNGHLFACGRSHGRHIGVFTVQIHISRKLLQMCNIQRLVQTVAAAGLLTGVGANTADGRRNGIILFDELGSLSKAIVGNQADITLAIAAGRASLLTGGDTITLMVGKQQLQRGFAGLAHLGGVRINHLTGSSLGGAGTEQAGRTLDSHHAQTAGTVRL